MNELDRTLISIEERLEQEARVAMGEAEAYAEHLRNGGHPAASKAPSTRFVAELYQAHERDKSAEFINPFPPRGGYGGYSEAWFLFQILAERIGEWVLISEIHEELGKRLREATQSHVSKRNVQIENALTYGKRGLLEGAGVMLEKSTLKGKVAYRFARVLKEEN